MENIATPLPAKAGPSKATGASALSQRQQGIAAADKALFDAFMAIGGQVHDGKKKTKAEDIGAEKSAPQGSPQAAPHTVSKDIAFKLGAKKPAPEHKNEQKAEPKVEAANDTGEQPVIEENADTLKLRLADGTELEVKPLRLIDLLVKDPATMAKLKKLLGADEDISDEDVLKLVSEHLREILEFAGKLHDQGLLVNADGQPAALDEPVSLNDALLQAVAMLMAAQQQKLSEAERKLREGLLEISLIGTDIASDDAVDAAVAQNLDAIDAWKAAVAGVAGGDEAIAADASAKNSTPHQNAGAQKEQHDAHPLDARAEENAAGGRSDVSLAKSQPSTGQTLPLLPTQLTGGQQRLPVAAQLGASNLALNLEGIARPGTAAALDAANKLARATARQPATLPQVYEQVSVRLNRMAKNGDKSMTIQLNPAELGRVEVKLDFAKDGAVAARLMADNQQTLDLLQRDSKALERALADAGLKLNQDSLQFEMRHGGEQQNKFTEAMKDRGIWRENSREAPINSDEIIINVSPAMIADGRVDIQV